MKCQHCGGELDPATGRHIDDDGQVMDYRENLIRCRPAPDIGRLREIEARFGKAKPSGRVYRGFDVASDA